MAEIVNLVDESSSDSDSSLDVVFIKINKPATAGTGSGATCFDKRPTTVQHDAGFAIYCPIKLYFFCSLLHFVIFLCNFVFRLCRRDLANRRQFFK